MQSYWTLTNDRRVAAALGTLRIPIQLRTTFLEKEGTRVTRFLLKLKSDDGKWDTKRIISGFKSGALASKEPAHPFLTQMRAFENRERVLDLALKGTPCRLIPVPNAGGIHQYVPGGDPLPGVKSGMAVIETGDIRMVAALGLEGFPVLKIQGTRGDLIFTLPAFHQRNDGRTIDGVALLRAWRQDKMSVPLFEPFALGAFALHNRERLLDAERKDVELVLVRKPRSLRSALVRADATPTAWDRVAEFFDQ